MTAIDPTGSYQHALQLLHLTDELNGAETASAAPLINLVLEPDDGLLDTLADFFEAAGEKAKESDHDDAFDLAADFNEAAIHIRQIGEDLHTASDRMHVLEPRRTASVTATAVPPLPPRRVSGHSR